MTGAAGHPTDRSGRLRNVADRETIHPLYLRALTTAMPVLTDMATSADTLVVRGSVANGGATPGTSDLDLVLVGRDAPPAQPGADLTAQIARACPAGTFVDVACVAARDVADLREGRTELIVNLATSSVVLHGPAPHVPACRPGRELALLLYPNGVAELGRMAELLRAGTAFPPYAGAQQPRSFWLTWLARDLIRCAGVAVMARDARFRRDLTGSIALVRDHSPVTAERLAAGVDWAVRAPDCPDLILPWARDCLERVAELWDD